MTGTRGGRAKRVRHGRTNGGLSKGGCCPLPTIQPPSVGKSDVLDRPQTFAYGLVSFFGLSQLSLTSRWRMISPDGTHIRIHIIPVSIRPSYDPLKGQAVNLRTTPWEAIFFVCSKRSSREQKQPQTLTEGTCDARPSSPSISMLLIVKPFLALRIDFNSKIHVCTIPTADRPASSPRPTGRRRRRPRHNGSCVLHDGCYEGRHN